MRFVKEPLTHAAVLTPAQLRAARALLGWSREDLADKSGVGAETVKNLERRGNRHRHSRGRAPCPIFWMVRLFDSRASSSMARKIWSGLLGKASIGAFGHGRRGLFVGAPDAIEKWRRGKVQSV